MRSKLFKVKEKHVGVDDGRFLGERDTLYSAHDMRKSFLERFALDIHNSVRVLILPVELPPNRENVLVILIGVGILGGFR